MVNNAPLMKPKQPMLMSLQEKRTDFMFNVSVKTTEDIIF